MLFSVLRGRLPLCAGSSTSHWHPESQDRDFAIESVVGSWVETGTVMGNVNAMAGNAEVALIVEHVQLIVRVMADRRRFCKCKDIRLHL